MPHGKLHSLHGTLQLQPQLGKGLLTSLSADGIRLSSVQGHLLLNKADNIGADGGFEDGRELDALSRSFSLVIVDGHQRSGDDLTLEKISKPH